MAHKDPEARKEYQRARYAKMKAGDPEKIAERNAKNAEYYAKKIKEDEAWAQKRREMHNRWYAEHGKENAQDRKGYIPWEEYVAKIEGERKSRAEYMRAWQKTEKGRRNSVAVAIRKRCGLTIEEYDAAYDAQCGQCRICGTFRDRYTQGRLVVDHCHKSGKFRALLCNRCNCAIGLLDESEEMLINAMQYLRDIKEGKVAAWLDATNGTGN